MTESAKYKKTWLVTTEIARQLICYAPAERLPTVQEFTEQLNSSRGIVQNSLQVLQKEQAISIEKRGKVGSFLSSIDYGKLFKLSGLEYITGSMASPVNRYFSALATGVCVSFSNCPTTFNFAFMQSSENRAKALLRMVYDFAIVSVHSAKRLEEIYPELTTAMVLNGSLYSPPFLLYSKNPDTTAIFDGAVVAVDPNSNDQFEITMDLCKEKQVELKFVPYLATGKLLAAGQVDFVVRREFEADIHNLAKSIPLSLPNSKDMTVPALLINRRNSGMSKILNKYLDKTLIGESQQAVMAGKMDAVFY